MAVSRGRTLDQRVIRSELTIETLKVPLPTHEYRSRGCTRKAGLALDAHQTHRPVRCAPFTCPLATSLLHRFLLQRSISGDQPGPQRIEMHVVTSARQATG
jgi:hypothetical protein